MADADDINAVPFADVNLGNVHTDPVVRKVHLKQIMVAVKINKIADMVGTAADRGPFGQLFFGINNLIRAVAQQKFGWTSLAARDTTCLAPSSFKREVVSREL